MWKGSILTTIKTLRFLPGTCSVIGQHAPDRKENLIGDEYKRKKGYGSVEEYRQMEDRCIDIESVRGGGDGGYGFMDRTGTPAVYLDCDSVSTFQEGLAFISVDGKYGYIDKTGQIVIQPVYDCADYFKGGLAEIWEDNRRGIIDRTGREILAPEYVEIERGRLLYWRKERKILYL